VFRSILSSRLASIGLASVIAVGVLGVGGVALADGVPGSGSPSATSTAAANHPHLLKGLLQDVVAKSGVTRADFRAGFKDGKSINDILGANAASVKAQVQADASARIATALSNGTITQAQAEAANAKLPAALDKLFASTPKQHGAHLAAIGKAAIGTIADVLKIDAATLRADLKSGKTVAQVAGPQTADVISALDAKADTAIDTAVTNGKVKAENAPTLKDRAHTRISDWVNNGRPKH
jgi:hypothetical protein